MRFVEGIESSIKLALYGKNADKLNVSLSFFDVRTASDGINIGKIVNECKTKKDLYNKVCDELIKETNTDYLHFSLIMGLYFGCYNLYNYLYVSDNMRKRIVESNPNRNDTLNFLIKNYSKILKHCSSVYGVSDEELKCIITKMLFVVPSDEDNYLYNSNVVRDIGKILIMHSLFDEIDNCTGAVLFFDELNESGKSKNNTCV